MRVNECKKELIHSPHRREHSCKYKHTNKAHIYYGCGVLATANENVCDNDN